ncbi:MAG: AraC family transcriptional regulator ligand-binding domain-containing protein [Pseudomonadota bacterium]
MAQAPAAARELDLPALYLRLFAERVEAAGHDPAAWLAGAGLSAAQLADPALHVSLPALRRLLASALALAGEPALGLLVGRRLLVGAHGALGFAAVNAGSLRQVVDVLERFIGTRFPPVALSHVEHGGRFVLRIDELLPLAEARRPVLEALLLALRNALDAVSLGAAGVVRATFPFPAPPYAPLVRELFACEVRWGAASAGLELAAQAVHAPLRTADPAAFDAAVRLCERELAALRGADTQAGRLRRALLQHGPATTGLTLAARLLHTTPRTLHRRLVAEGTSFRALQDDVRHRLALEHLEEGRLALKQIAHLLGYDDLANFRRAFRRWEGVAPGEWRRGAAAPLR